MLLEALGVSDRIAPRVLVEKLWRDGILDKRQIERIFIRHKVEKLCSIGENRNEAMKKIAAEHYCSYGKISAIVYDKTKP